MLKMRTAKMDELLTSVGLSHNDFIRLRDRRTAEWISSAQNGTGKLDKAQIEALVGSSPKKGRGNAGGGGVEAGLLDEPK